MTIGIQRHGHTGVRCHLPSSPTCNSAVDVVCSSFRTSAGAGAGAGAGTARDAAALLSSALIPELKQTVDDGFLQAVPSSGPGNPCAAVEVPDFTTVR